MTFALTSLFGFLVGAVVIGLALWALQRLRVQHREVEVITTLFWQAALKETRARVFVRRFRHWPAWLLLFAICTLLWMLFAQPLITPADSRQHVVLVDWSATPDQREAALEVATETIKGLPKTSRELIAVDVKMQTLLSNSEDVYLATARAESIADQSGPNGMESAIEALAARSSESQPLSIHLIGEPEIEQAFLEMLPESVQIQKVPFEDAEDTEVQLTSLGYADAKSGIWNRVDVRFTIDSAKELNGSGLQVQIDGQTPSNSLQELREDVFELVDLPARGQTFSVQIQGASLGQLTLPMREPTRIAIEDGVPTLLRELIALDPSLEIVANEADVSVGFSEACDLKLSSQETAAFEIVSNQEDPNAALADLIDELALTQIDATSLAQQAGQVIDVQVQSGAKRKIALWESLFTPTFDFAQSRACPIFVSRSIRWLANKPSEVTWAAQGMPLPVAGQEFEIPLSDIATTADGTDVQVPKLALNLEQSAELTSSRPTSWIGKITPATWLGVLLSILLVGEWALYQKGRMP